MPQVSAAMISTLLCQLPELLLLSSRISLTSNFIQQNLGPTNLIGQNDASLECGALTADTGAFGRLFTIQCEALGQF